MSGDFAARHSSETAEHGTPETIIHRARAVLGVIDLDPASSEAFNARVQATRIFDAETNGFEQEWRGRVFLNPPGGWCDIRGQRVIKANKARGIESCTKTGACGLAAPHTHEDVDSSQKRWWQKLALEWWHHHVESAVFVCFSVELLQSTQVEPIGMLPLNFPICYPARRVSYLRPDGTPGTSPPHASAVICVTGQAPTAHLFRRVFSPMGRVVVPDTFAGLALHHAQRQNGAVQAAP